MNRSILLPIAILFLSSGLIKAQPELFTSNISELKNNIKAVSTSKVTYEQNINILQPGVIELIINDIDLKGNKIEYKYHFNFADLDPIMVREITDKDNIYVQLIMSSNQKLIKVFKNGEFDRYDDVARIYAVEINNARKIGEIIRQIIPISEVIMNNKFNLPTYEEKLNWLLGNIKTVDLTNVTYQQILKSSANEIGKVIIETVKTQEKSTKNSTFELNLADINPNSVKFEVSGALFSIVMETNRKSKIIKSFTDGVQDNYVYKLELIAYDIENARDIKYILSKLIPQAKEKLTNSFPAANDVNIAMSLLSKAIKQVIVGDVTCDQSITNNCTTVFNVDIDDLKKKEVFRYEFNLSDINLNSADYDISGKTLAIECQTQGAFKLIKVYKNNEQQDYTNKLRIVCNDMENARLINYLLSKSIPLCAANIVRLVPTADLGSKINWLINNTKEVTLEGTVYNQKLEKITDDNNKLRYTLKEVKEQKSVENIYEFNLSDINPTSVEYSISGKKLSILLNTNYNAKVIKVYKDGEIQNYTNNLTIYITDIELARNTILGFKECITENSK